MFTSFVVSLVLAASALANVYITSPTSSTTWTGGQQATINWQDDGSSPSLASFGTAMFSIYVGNANQQTSLQLISSNVSVANVSSLTFTPSPTIGPDSNEYFIRVQSLNLKDASNPQYPALAFSAKFSLTGMSGTFNSSLQAEIDGQSTAPIGGPTSGLSAATAAAPAATTAAAATTTVKGAAASTATATGTSKSNGAGRHGVTSLAGLAAAAVLVGVAIL
ncbi:hypothetical protein EDD16DRAFT_1517248 [Pisolithus croceorrhizus]|nr:hypothetical protein EV401DRAFT_2127358 [Pisolithus croceorrhizus]KAI6124997.1 hypothetical protein EDD16DRAFT_1517248 [Pisolithus croceorrhizus]KAI6161921.1 hypothetical protein EDD17DRAFT_1508761 [Pisolithus thermaeus]